MQPRRMCTNSTHAIMLSSRATVRASLSGRASVRALSVLSSHSTSPFAPAASTRHNNNNYGPHSQQQRTLLGLVHAIDKRVYRWAQGVLPPISKTENIALGCGTIGESSHLERWNFRLAFETTGPLNGLWHVRPQLSRQWNFQRKMFFDSMFFD